MEIEKFTGAFGKPELLNGRAFHTFQPNFLPVSLKYSNSLVKELSESLLSLGNLSGLGRRLPNPHLLIMPYLKKEAVLSSKIEGTRTSLSEIFLHEKENKTPNHSNAQAP